MTTNYEDLQNRLRRNNFRIYQVPEETEGKGMKAFVKHLLAESLKLPPDMDMNKERAHRSLAAKTKGPNASPRYIIVRLLDFSVKERILQTAWSHKVTFQGSRICFDHDYSPALQKKRGDVRRVIKQLKEKGIRAKCPYPAQLQMRTASGEKMFETLVDALPTLKKLGIAVQVDEWDVLQRQITKDSW